VAVTPLSKTRVFVHFKSGANGAFIPQVHNPRKSRPMNQPDKFCDGKWKFGGFYWKFCGFSNKFHHRPDKFYDGEMKLHRQPNKFLHAEGKFPDGKKNFSDPTAIIAVQIVLFCALHGDVKRSAIRPHPQRVLSALARDRKETPRRHDRLHAQARHPHEPSPQTTKLFPCPLNTVAL
jgi:hypothetical protein